MAAYPDLFHDVAEKLGPQPDLEPQWAEADAPVGPTADALPASWFDPSFDPDAEPATPFVIRFSESIPVATGIGPPRPLPVYVAADVIAVYAPWHVYGERYGAYIRQDKLLGLASWMSDGLGVPFPQVAPHIL